jgi:integrase
MKTKPNVISIGNGIHRLDLRGKAFRNILGTVSGGKKSLEFQSRAAAERKADEISGMLEKFWSKKMETLESVMRIDPLALQAKLDPFGKTVADAVDFYARHLTEQRESFQSQTMGVLMDEWLAEKKMRVDQKTLREDTYETIFYKGRGYKAQWQNRPVSTLTSGEIRQWVESLKSKCGKSLVRMASQVSKQHQLSYLSQFFIWSKKRYGVPRDNPCEDIEIERNEDAGTIGIFTPDESAKIMEHSTTKRFASLLPFHAICLFSGVRVDECERLTWDNIDFEDNSIVLANIHAKTRGRRPAMQPNLVAWLKWFHEKFPQYPLIPSQGFEDKKRQFRKSLGLEWHKNGMRHSAASYTLGARIGDYGYLEQHFGNSRTMLQSHYLNFPSKDESARYWAILPPKL